PALRCGQHRRARAHAVTGKGDSIGVDADLAGAESYADADVERRSKICSQAEMGRDRTAFAVGRRCDNSPGSEVLECLLVLVGPDHPPVREGNSGEIETGFNLPAVAFAHG